MAIEGQRQLDSPDCPPECFPDDDGDRHQHCPQDGAVADILAAELDARRRAAGDEG